MKHILRRGVWALALALLVVFAVGAALAEGLGLSPDEVYLAAQDNLNMVLAGDLEDLAPADALREIVAQFGAIRGYSYANSYRAYAQALLHVEEGRFAEAEALAEALKTAPQFDQMLQQQAHTAIRGVEQLAAYVAGRKAEQEGNTFAALEAYGSCISFYDATDRRDSLTGKDNRAIPYAQAESERKAGSWAEAAALYQSASGYKSADQWQAYCTAMAQYQRAMYEDAAGRFAALGDFQKADSWAVYCKGLALQSMGSWSDAAKQFKTLGTWKNSDKWTTYCTAVAQFEKGQYAKAIPQLTGLKTFQNAVRYAAYSAARQMMKAKEYGEAELTYLALGDFLSAKQEGQDAHKKAQVTPTPKPTPKPTSTAGTKALKGYKDYRQVIVKSVEAPNPEYKNRYSKVASLCDGDDGTSYQLSTKKISLGSAYSVIVFNFTTAVTLDEVWIKNGYWGGYGAYMRNSRVKNMYVEFRYTGSSGYKDLIRVTLEDDSSLEDWQKIVFSTKKKVKGVRLTINSAYLGTRFPTDVCISEVMFVQKLK